MHGETVSRAWERFGAGSQVAGGANMETFDESDVDLLGLTGHRFEEACFDLLVALGYEALTWRTGGADAGRDIDGRLTMMSTLVGEYPERWFFECKCHKKGVPAESLQSKMAWADAEKPNHLAILCSSHLTRSAREWLAKTATTKPYAVHVVEGKALRRFFAAHPDIVCRYFLSGARKLLLEARRAWLVHDIIPEPETLAAISNVDCERLSPEELAFVWCSAKLRNQDLERLFENTEPVTFGHMFRLLSSCTTSPDSVLTGRDLRAVRISFEDSVWELVYRKLLAAEVLVDASKANPCVVLICP